MYTHTNKRTYQNIKKPNQLFISLINFIIYPNFLGPEGKKEVSDPFENKKNGGSEGERERGVLSWQVETKKKFR